MRKWNTYCIKFHRECDKSIWLLFPALDKDRNIFGTVLALVRDCKYLTWQILNLGFFPQQPNIHIHPLARWLKGLSEDETFQFSKYCLPTFNSPILESFLKTIVFYYYLFMFHFCIFSYSLLNSLAFAWLRTMWQIQDGVNENMIMLPLSLSGENWSRTGWLHLNFPVLIHLPFLKFHPIPTSCNFLTNAQIKRNTGRQWKLFQSLCKPYTLHF